MTSKETIDLFMDELTKYLDFNADFNLISSNQKSGNNYHVYLTDIKKEFLTLIPNKSSVIIKELSKSQAEIYHKLSTVWNLYLETIYGVLEKNGHYISINEFIETPQSLACKERSISLAEYVTSFGCFSETDALILLYQLCEGVETLQKMNFTHGDISPQNILLTDTSKWESIFSPLPSTTSKISVKIIDFDVSKKIKNCKHNVTTVVGTEPFAAPEILDFRYPSDKIDIYSLGCILHFMIIGKSPKNFDIRTSQKLMHPGTFRIIKHCTSSYETRYKNTQKLKKEILRQFKYPTNIFLTILYHVPGFRSHKFWKMVIAIYVYSACITSIAVLFHMYHTIPRDELLSFIIFFLEIIFVFDVFHLGDLSSKYAYLKTRFPALKYIVKSLIGLGIFILLCCIL